MGSSDCVGPTQVCIGAGPGQGSGWRRIRPNGLVSFSSVSMAVANSLAAQGDRGGLQGGGCPEWGQLPSSGFGKGGGHEERITGNNPWPGSSWETGSGTPMSADFPALRSPPLPTASGPMASEGGDADGIQQQPMPPAGPRPMSGVPWERPEASPQFPPPRPVGMRSCSERTWEGAVARPCPHAGVPAVGLARLVQRSGKPSWRREPEAVLVGRL